jgi:hypothetical protein
MHDLITKYATCLNREHVQLHKSRADVMNLH